MSKQRQRTRHRGIRLLMAPTHSEVEASRGGRRASGMSAGTRALLSSQVSKRQIVVDTWYCEHGSSADDFYLSAVAWNGWSAATGSVTIHNWNDGADDDEAEPRMGTKVDAKLQRESDDFGDIDASHGEGGQPAPRRPRRQFA